MNLNKIIRSLDLSKSDARDKTIQGIIEYILHSVNEQIGVEELNEYIKIELNIELFKSELIENLEVLIDQNGVSKDSKNKYSLTTDRELQLKKLELSNKDERDIRFKQFSDSIKKYYKRPLKPDEIQLLWEVLSEYIYECYLEHGKSALSAFYVRKGTAESEIDLSAILNKHLDKLGNAFLSKVLKKYIENFATEISIESLDYLMNLANKSEAFFALGLSKEEYEFIYKDIAFDWKIFVDTNFLYSILDLHSHPDTEASKALVELGKSLKIKFYYLSPTLKELQNRSKDFDAVIPQNLNYSQISALVKSSQLDDLAMRYFQKKLIDMENTPHPKDIVGHAQLNLKNKGINIFAFQFDRLTDQQEHLKDQESKYLDYLKLIDEQRGERGLPIKGQKDIKQVEHDIFLREAILFLRDAKVASINDVKYLGVTLDRRLIKYDHYVVMRKRDGVNIPTFFSPGILLKKMLNYLPVQSNDYRRAFIKTISTPALDNNIYTSKVAIRSVKYFHNMGISDEKMILNCIKDEMFLNKFKDLENGEPEILSEFVESKLQKDFQELDTQFAELEGLLEQKNGLILDISEQSMQAVAQNEKLETDVSELKERLRIYNLTINQLHIQSTKGNNNSIQLTLEHERANQQQDKSVMDLQKHNEVLTNQIIGFERDKLFKRWRNKSFLLLIPVFIIVPHIFMVIFWQNAHWNYVSTALEWFESQTSARKDILKAIAGIILTLLLILPVKTIWKRFFSKKAKKEFYESLELKPIVT